MAAIVVLRPRSARGHRLGARPPRASCHQVGSCTSRSRMERAGRRRQAVGRSPWPRPWQDGLGASARARHDIADVDATGLAVVAAVDEVARGVALVGGRVPKSLRYLKTSMLVCGMGRARYVSGRDGSQQRRVRFKVRTVATLVADENIPIVPGRCRPRLSCFHGVSPE